MSQPNETTAELPWGAMVPPPDDRHFDSPMSRDDSIVIAPWLAPPDPPAPATQKRSFGFASSAQALKQASHNNLRIRPRGDSDVSQTDRPPSRDKDGKKYFFNFMKKKASRQAFARDEEDTFGTTSHGSFGSAGYGASVSTLSVSNYMASTSNNPSPSNVYSSGSSSSPPPKRFRKPSRIRPMPSQLSNVEPELTLDMNLGDMSGIIDTARVPSNLVPPDSAAIASPWDTMNTAIPAVMDGYSYGRSSHDPTPSASTQPPINGTFTNIDPFGTNPYASRPMNGSGLPPSANLPTSISPKTQFGLSSINGNGSQYNFPQSPPDMSRTVTTRRPHYSTRSPPPPPLLRNPLPSPNWVAPESWATIPREGEGADRYASSDDGNVRAEDDDSYGEEIPSALMGGGLSPLTNPGTNGSPSMSQFGSSTRSKGGGKGKEKDLPRRPPSAGGESFASRQRPKATQSQIRVYRSDGTYHVISCPVQTTVGDLQLALTKRLMIRGETHRMYLRERGRERALGQREEPASLVRRRLEQAGYDPADNLEAMGGEDLGFLLRFIFRNASLGGIDADEEAFTADFEHIELPERSLETVPVILHQHAGSIITLNLSKNPLVDLPLDFVQDCGRLLELRLSHVAMKRVPHTIQEIKSLQWLDISCNRIADLEHAGLERIKGLRQVFVQNNRITNLPRSFAHMTSLKYLNISNNKFDQVPPVVCDIHSLVDLDLSFNSIQTFPVELARLVNLERLIMVGNRVKSFPPVCRKMTRLRELDCRRNSIVDLSPLSDLPNLESLFAEHNEVLALDLTVGPKLLKLVTSHNPITKFHIHPAQSGLGHYSLTSLDLSHMKLSTFADDGIALASFTSLESLKLDYNKFHALPDVVCSLSQLHTLSCTNNDLHNLPEQIGLLQKLRTLSVHNNNIRAIPESLWECGSLFELNVSSNILISWQDPPQGMSTGTVTPSVSLLPTNTINSMTTNLSPEQPTPPSPNLDNPPDDPARKSSAAGLSMTARTTPPLALSLQRLYLADNRLDFEIFRALAIMRELRILNLSFNDLSDLPPLHLQTFAQLQELYLSGNNLTSLPGDHVHKLTKLKVLHLNGNKLQTLPAEMRKITALETLDVGNNMLKYNIANWQFDWNWNFNSELKYLNLSGNKRLEIKNMIPTLTSESASHSRSVPPLSDFANLTKLRVLGLMDVTLVIPSVPDDTYLRRVRTSDTEINRMAYGIADTLGKVDGPSTFDLVIPNFRNKDNESLFGMFGRTEPLASSPRAAKFLQEHFARNLIAALKRVDPRKNEGVNDALRRAFLSLNKSLYDYLAVNVSNPAASAAAGRKLSTISTNGPVEHDLRSGASAIIVYIVDHPIEKVMHIANVGDMLAVVSRSTGSWHPVSRKHDPFDRYETARIRAAEGWVSPKGMVNDEEDLSRSFGLYHLLPAVNACPDVQSYTLTDQDELVIIGNRGLWDHVSFRTAVDIARANRHDPMMAAQMLRDFAMSYGADGNTVIMVVAVRDLFPTGNQSRSRMPPIDSGADADPYAYLSLKGRGPARREGDRTLARLDREVPPPRGHLALVFTDIRNSTTLWEKNSGMGLALKVHNQLLRRQLRVVGGYEVKTEGDAFVISFPTVPAAMLWCFTVQVQLLHEDWPLEILESEEGREIRDSEGRVIARGLSVRMGIHWGKPVCELDPLTNRMDYFGPVVNRSARISAQAQGGQIMVSADVINEINAWRQMEEPVPEAIELRESWGHVETLKRMGIEVKKVGDRSLKGFEVPETLSLVFPTELSGRLEMRPEPLPAAGSRVQFSVAQIKQLAILCIRLEALSSRRVLRDISQHKPPAPGESTDGGSNMFYVDPEILMPVVKRDASDDDLLLHLDALSTRIENALSTIYVRQLGGFDAVLSGLQSAMQVDSQMLIRALGMFNDLLSVPPR